MARKQNPAPGKLVLSFIYSSLDGLADALRLVERRFGEAQFETIEIECECSESYHEEMGHKLTRRFFSFEKEYQRDYLPEIKNYCHKVEQKFADQVGDFGFRTVNIDPGILSLQNLVIGSHRDANHRIYLRDGVYGELTLVWSRGQFVRLPWTPPDFYHNEAIDFFERVYQTFDIVDDSGHSSIAAML
jgi:hypothetical protein